MSDAKMAPNFDGRFSDGGIEMTLLDCESS